MSTLFELLAEEWQPEIPRVDLRRIHALAKQLVKGQRCSVEVRAESDYEGWHRVRLLWHFASIGKQRAPEIRVYRDGIIATDGLSTPSQRAVFRSLSDAIDRQVVEVAERIGAN